MKACLSLFISMLLLLQICAAQTAEDRPPMSTAVFDFSEGSEGLKGQGKSVGLLLNASLSMSDGLLMVERAELDKILSEQELNLTGAVDSANLVKVGRLTGAQVLVTGRIFSVGKKNYLVAKIISSETSRVYGSTSTYEGTDGLEDAVGKLANQIAEVISKKGDTLVTKAESWEEMINRLKQDLKADLPKVYVKVSEQHLRQAVPDPACETEIQKVLGGCGFTIVENESDADVSITGEAFSQLATRKGNLVACRARAEIKIKGQSAEQPVKADRITVGAVDLTEEVAGKSALQKAGLKLAQDFVESYKK